MNIKDFLEENSIEFLQDENLFNHTTYKVGGKCDFYCTPDTIDKLIELLKFIKENNINYKMLGNGSNVIISSDRFNGIIINLCKLNNYSIEEDIINVEAGVLLIKLSNICANNSLSGLEFASGIPGNVGGAIYMNAGAYKSDMSEVLIDVTYIDENNELVTKKKEELDFSYRHSIFQEKNYIIVSARLKLYSTKNKNEILTLMNDRRKRRMDTQPLEYPSAGSVFRNPSDTIFSGQLIESLGFKGYSVGGAKVSEKHANFIVNYNHATAEDIAKLIGIIKEKVKEKYNIDLKVEQEFVNFGE